MKDAYLNKESSEIITLVDSAAKIIRNDFENKPIDLKFIFNWLLQKEISKLVLIRPVLPDVSLYSPEDILPAKEYKGAETLFAYIRLMHCFSKRYIKNIKNKTEFVGAKFCRGWRFDKEQTDCVIEEQTISAKNLSFSSRILYSYADKYTELASMLISYQTKNYVNNKNTISFIVSILTTGKLPQLCFISDNFANFLFKLTYMLFGTEVERNPAALIHNIMGLDLLENDIIKDWSELFSK